MSRATFREALVDLARELALPAAVQRHLGNAEEPPPKGPGLSWAVQIPDGWDSIVYSANIELFTATRNRVVLSWRIRPSFNSPMFIRFEVGWLEPTVDGWVHHGEAREDSQSVAFPPPTEQG